MKSLSILRNTFVVVLHVPLILHVHSKNTCYIHLALNCSREMFAFSCSLISEFYRCRSLFSRSIIGPRLVNCFRMREECAIDVHRISECCAAAVSYVANFVLILLILFRTSKELHVYGRVLLVNCIVDVVFTTTSFVIEAVMRFS